MIQRKKSILASAGALLVGAAQAQVTLDGTLGRAGTLPGPDYHITADLGRQVGGNLFHSFGQFSIHTGESATFSGPNSVNNIIGRVTGGDVSLIDGALRSTIPGANLYLLNPAGVLLGEHARLDVPGSVHVSTADYLRLSDGGRFDARTPANSALTVAPVAAFGFLGGTPGRITVEGAFLKVPEGQTLSLIGGDITLTNATLYAPAGRINVAAVASAGEVIPTDTDLTLQGFGALGTFTIERTTAARPTVDLGSPFGEVTLADLDTSGAGGGAIFIRGGQWFSRGGWVFADTYGGRNGRGIDVALTGEVRLEDHAVLATRTFGSGDAGPVTLEVGRLSLTGGSEIGTATHSAGRAGELSIAAREAVIIAGYDAKGNPSSLASNALEGSTGDAGAIRVTTPRLEVEGGAIQSNTRGAGNGGSIVLDVGRLSLTAGGQISASTRGSGRGGDIQITADEAVTIAGADADGLYSGLFASTSPNSTGDAGAIRVTTPRFELDGGLITSSTRGAGAGGLVALDVGRLSLTEGGQILTATRGAGRGGDILITAREAVTIDGTDAEGFSSGLYASAASGSTGNAGNINITTARLALTGGGTISAGTGGAGRGGTLTINASEAVTIDGIAPNGDHSGLYVSAGSTATGNAGDITLTTPSLTLSNGGGIFARSSSTTGGNILINADHLKLFDGSEISSSVAGDEFSNGGNVTLNSTNIVALNGSKITAKAKKGKGGNILVNAEVFLHDAASVDEVLNASSQVAGNDGTVQNNAPTTDISGSLTALPARYLNAADQLSHRCGVGDQDTRSSFTVQGRGALPLDPDEPAAVQVSGCRSEQPAPARATPPPSAMTATPATATLGFGDR